MPGDVTAGARWIPSKKQRNRMQRASWQSPSGGTMRRSEELPVRGRTLSKIRKLLETHSPEGVHPEQRIPEGDEEERHFASNHELRFEQSLRFP